MPKKIGIICNRLASNGGMESHSLSIISELDRLGYPLVIFSKNHKPLPQLEKFEIFSCSTKMVPRVLEDWYFSHWLRKITSNKNIQAFIGFCRNTESDILFCGGTHRGFSSTRKSRIFYDLVINRFEDVAFRKTKFVLPASKFMAEELKTLYGLSQEKIFVAYPPVPEENFKCLSDAQRAKNREELGLSQDKTVLLFPSASGHNRKGLPFILNSLKGIDNIEIAIAGKPARIDNAAVVSIGYQNNMEKAYNAVDYTILASSYEPFGLVGIESILCGTPVIMANNIGCTEVISTDACITFSRKNAEELHHILTSLPPPYRTSIKDLHYDLSVKHQVEMLLTLIDKI